jgi:uncharacterized protein (DUF1684 family)/tetratricopeptide (TPR) repeat protein
MVASLSLAPGTSAGIPRDDSRAGLAEPQSSESYVSGIDALRSRREEEFRNPRGSPLAVIAVARVDRARTSIGSAESADLRLPREAVADIHAEILREEESGGKTVWRLRPVGGRVWTDTDPPQPVEDLVLSIGTRARIGRFVVYLDNLGTFGTVVRALDFSAPAFTRFDHLNYFPANPEFRVEGMVSPYPRPERITIVDTRGWQRPAWRYGDVKFSLAGKPLMLQLWVFTSAPGPKDAFFIAFTDLTSGKETYAAGRYLEPAFVPSGAITLDFNLATNPSCAYNDGFACPLPPGQNLLPVAVKAGELKYHVETATQAGPPKPKPNRPSPVPASPPGFQRPIIFAAGPGASPYRSTAEAESAFLAGRRARENGSLMSAMQAFSHAVAIDPDYLDACAELASAIKAALVDPEDYARYTHSMATRTLTNVLNFYSARARANPLAAAYQWALGELDVSPRRDAAERFFRNAIANDPAFARAHQSLAFTLAYHCDFEGAREHFRKAMELKAGDPEALADYARQVRDSDPELFRKLANDFLSRHPGHPEGAGLLSSLAMDEADPGVRIALLERLKRLYPPSEFDVSEWHMRFLFDAYNASDPVKALALAQEMTLIVPGGEVEQDWLGIARYAQDMMSARSMMDRRSYPEASKLLGKTPLPYRISPDPLVLAHAEAMAGAGDLNRAYKSVATAFARRPSAALRPALERYGRSLKKSPAQMEQDVRESMKDNGDKVGNFRLAALDGNRQVRLSDYRGRIVLLSLWYPGCVNCREDLPYMQRILDRYAGRGFSILTVNISPEEDEIAALQMRRFGFVSLKVPNPSWVWERFRVPAFPQHMLLDREGRALFVPEFWGFDPRRDFELALETLLDFPSR